MLTPTDIHYIVGLLSKVSHPENMEIELGDYVYDEASKSKRDVDVTIKVLNNDGSISVFKGIEVKAHSRKLGTEAVEQLIRKLADMPSVTHPAIVSASGYTQPAMRKAKKHGITLYELKAWTTSETFDFFQCEPMPAVHTEYKWAHIREIKLNPPQQFGNEELQFLRSNPDVFFEDKLRPPRKLLAWLDDVAQLAAKETEARSGARQHSVQTINTQANLTIEYVAYVVLNSSRIYIKKICIIGVVEVRTFQPPSTHKALFKVGEKTPIAGCCISDFGNFGLVGLTVSKDRKLDLITIPVSDRNKKKIYRQKIQSNPEPNITI